MRRFLLILAVIVFSPRALAQQADTDVAPAGQAEQDAAAPATDDSTPRWAKEPWEKVRFGLKAGATWSVLQGQLPIPDVGTFGFDGDFGFVAGASFEVPVSKSFSIQPELLIVRKHAAIDLSGSTYTGSEKLSANYFEVPLLAKWYPGERRGTIFSLQAGPVMGLRMAAMRESRSGLVWAISSNHFEGEDGSIVDVEGSTLVKATDWGLVAGAGIEFHEFIWALTFDLRYNHGLSNIDNSDSTESAQWRALYFMAGVTW